MSLLRLALALSLTLSVTAGAADPPAIEQIRANYAAVNKQIAAGRYRKDEGDTGCGPIVYFRWRDGKGVTRRLDQHLHDTGDSLNPPVGVLSMWFDAAGRLDFALYRETEYEYKLTDGAMLRADDGHQTILKVTPKVELRVYFDDRGRMLRTLNKYPMSQGQTATTIQRIKDVAATPWQTLIAPSGCAS